MDRETAKWMARSWRLLGVIVGISATTGLAAETTKPKAKQPQPHARHTYVVVAGSASAVLDGVAPVRFGDDSFPNSAAASSEWVVRKDLLDRIKERRLRNSNRSPAEVAPSVSMPLMPAPDIATAEPAPANSELTFESQPAQVPVPVEPNVAIEIPPVMPTTPTPVVASEEPAPVLPALTSATDPLAPPAAYKHTTYRPVSGNQLRSEASEAVARKDNSLPRMPKMFQRSERAETRSADAAAQRPLHSEKNAPKKSETSRVLKSEKMRIEKLDSAVASENRELQLIAEKIRGGEYNEVQNTSPSPLGEER